MVPQDGRPPFIDIMLDKISGIMAGLDAREVQSVFEAMGEIIKFQPDETARKHLFEKLMLLPRELLRTAIATASTDSSVLYNDAECNSTCAILNTYKAVAAAVGSEFNIELVGLFVRGRGGTCTGWLRLRSF